MKEKIDLDKLRVLTSNYDSLKEKIGEAFDSKKCKRVNYEQTKTILKKYLKSKDSTGTSTISYNYSSKSNDGRLFSQGVSLQGLPRVVRHTISKDFYWDIDIKNAHPVIFKWYCDEKGIKCDFLTHYINNRDTCLTELMTNCNMTKDEAKNSVLSIINGGFGNPKITEINNPNWYPNLFIEINRAHEQVIKNYPKYVSAVKRQKGDNTFNINGKVCNKMFCHFEGIILNHMAEYCKFCGLDVGALCFDGLMVYKKEEFDLITFLKNLEVYIFDKTTIPLVIVEKEMNEDLDITDLHVIDDEIEVDEIIFNNEIDITKEKYYWVDFERKYCYTIFDSLNDLKENIIRDLPRVLAKLTMGKGYYIKKEHDDLLCNIVSLKDMSRIIFKHNSINVDKHGLLGNEIMLVSLTEIYNECKLPLYSHPDMIVDLSLKTNAYNTFKGIKATKIDEIDNNLIEDFFNHIQSIICNDDIEASHFFISWLRWIMIHPHIKSKVFVCLISEEGYGKSTIGAFLSKYIFGDSVSYTSTGLEQIVAGFNCHLSGKLFCQVEELPATSETFHNQFNKMKHIITDDKIAITPKGVDTYMQTNFFNFYACSNNKFSLRMASNDTRYFVLEILKKMSSDYWTEYYEKFQNQKFADMLYSYLLKTNDCDFVNFTGRPKIPMTELKKDLIDFSLPPCDRFFRDIMEGEYKLSSNILKEEFVYKGKTYKFACTSGDIFIEFQNWGLINGEHGLKPRALDFKSIHNGKFRFINLQDKITNLEELNFKDSQRLLERPS